MAPTQNRWLDQVGSVLERLNQGVIISDEDRRIIFANSMFLEMGKMSAEDIVEYSQFYSRFLQIRGSGNYPGLDAVLNSEDNKMSRNSARNEQEI